MTRCKYLLILGVVLLFSCTNNNLKGKYVYTKIKNENKNETLFDAGKSIGCAMIGSFEFKNGKCYMSPMGSKQRMDYEVEDGVIYLGSTEYSNAGIGITIIDENTLDYMGCKFVKEK